MKSTITQSIKKILVIRPDRLGDIILTLPVVRNLKESFPEANITYLCTQYTSEILKSYSLISDLIIYNNFKEYNSYHMIHNLAKEFSRAKFDLAIHLLPRFSLALATYLAQIKYNVGTGFRWYSFLFTQRQYDHRKYNLYHEGEYNLRLLNKIGIDSTYHSDAYSYFKFPESLVDSIQKMIKEKFNGRPFIIIHPGSGGSSIDWPVMNFIKLIKILNDYGKYEVVVTGVETEKDILVPFFQTNINFIDLVGSVDLNELAILIANAHLFISNSTGPLHLAVAMGTKVLGFYPNSPTLGPGRWGPIGYPTSSYLTPELNPAKPKTDPVNNDMKKITPEQVFARIKQILD